MVVRTGLIHLTNLIRKETTAMIFDVQDVGVSIRCQIVVV